MMYFTPPELLLDVPFSMGCYQLPTTERPDGNSLNPESPNSDQSPASCILTCLRKGSQYRYAGIPLLHLFTYRHFSYENITALYILTHV